MGLTGLTGIEGRRPDAWAQLNATYRAGGAAMAPRTPFAALPLVFKLRLD
jgi:hypothetical protein